jgi:hypothetical protein
MRWQRRGHLLVDQPRLCHRKQLPILTTKMINTTRKGSPEMQPLLIVFAAALRAPAENLARRRLPTLSYRRGEEQAQPKYGRRLWVAAASGAALALLTIEPVFDQWLGHRRAPPAGRTWLPAVDPDAAAAGKDHFLAARMAADHHDDLGDRDT